MKKASYSDDNNVNEPQEKDKNWIKNFIEEQEPKEDVLKNIAATSSKELNAMLAKLVKSESYEAAAKIRDELSRRK